MDVLTLMKLYKAWKKDWPWSQHEVLKTLDPSIILERERRRERQPQEPHIASKKKRADRIGQLLLLLDIKTKENEKARSF